MNFTFTHGADIDEKEAKKLVKLFQLHQEVASLLKVKYFGC